MAEEEIPSLVQLEWYNMNRHLRVGVPNEFAAAHLPLGRNNQDLIYAQLNGRYVRSCASISRGWANFSRQAGFLVDGLIFPDRLGFRLEMCSSSSTWAIAILRFSVLPPEAVVAGEAGD